MRVTIVPYMYRDASNFKAFGDIIVAGAITDEQRAALKASLDVNDTFIPEQLHLEHLGWQEDTWTSFPASDDHVWHELLVDEIRVEENDHQPVFTVDDLVKWFVDAAVEGWDDTSRYSLDN